MMCHGCSVLGSGAGSAGFDNAMDIWDIRDHWDPDTGLWSRDSFPVKVSVRVRTRVMDTYYAAREFISYRLA